MNAAREGDPLLGSTLPIADGGQMRAELRVLLRGRGRAVLQTITLLVLAAGLGLVSPFVIGWLVDSAGRTAGSVPVTFWIALAVLIAGVLLGGLVEFLGVVAVARVGETMIATLRERFVDAALRLPQDVVERVGSGDVVARSSRDIGEVSDSVPNVLPQLASALFTVGFSVVALATIDGRFALALVATIPLYLLTLRWYRRTAPPVYAARRAADAVRSHQVLTTVHALPTVTAYRLGETRESSARAATWNLLLWGMAARKVVNRLFASISNAEGIGLLLVLGIGVALTAAGDVRVGQVTTAALLYFRVVAPLGDLLYVVDALQSAAASFARVVGVTQLPPPETHPTPKGAEEELGGELGGELVDELVVDLRAVGFAYRSGYPVLQDVDLTIRRGERLALVGSSGSGKTSLARLVAGTHAPSSGTLRHGVSLEDIAYLSQEHHLFDGTLRENLVLTDRPVTDAELRRALEEVGGSGLLNSLPDGLDTRIGPVGHRLAASEAQLLALARLLLLDPVVAILDEATADADSREADALEAATARVLQGRTGIVIAHRLSQTVHCDRIVVLDRGRVQEVGTHAELLARGGRFAELWAAWSRPPAP